MAEYLSEYEQRARQIAEGLAEMLKLSPWVLATEWLDMYRDYNDKYRLMCGPDFVLSLMDRLEEALKENEKDKRQIQIWLEQYAELATENKELRQRIADLEEGDG